MPTPSVLFLDIDGTITRAERGLDSRVIEPIRELTIPIIFATGKAFPYPIALCHYLAVPERVVAENGGIVCVDGSLERSIDRDRLKAFTDDARSNGIDFGWDGADTVNRWRETEIAIERAGNDRAELEPIASRHGLEVIDSGYAYHIKDPELSKGEALKTACSILEIEPTRAVAIGDSENDVSMFELAERSYAVANADQDAKAAADCVTTDSYADGMLEALSDIVSH